MPDKENNRIWEKVFTEKAGFVLVVVGFAIIIGAAIAFIFFSHWPFSCTIDEEVVGQFGDFVGGVVGTLFALAGVVLYYVALNEQRKDLKINHENLKIQTEAFIQQIEEFKAQKEEMEETRKVYVQQTELFQEQTNLYREQSEAMKKQAEEAKKQTAIYLVEQFDASFYPLLNLICGAQHENAKTIEGIKSLIQSKIEKSCDINTIYGIILGEYKNQYQTNGEPIVRMFDMITQLVRLIYKAPVLDEDKKKHYISILHSQLSECTNVVLFYHLFSEAGKNEKPLYLQSGFFDEMSFMQRCEFAILYPSNCYFSLSKFAGELSSFISKSLDNATSMEGISGGTDEKINVMGVEAQSKLRQEDNILYYHLNVRQTEWNKTGLEKNDFSQFLTFLLYDVRYLSTFNMPVVNKVISRVKEGDDIISFVYEIIID